MLKLLSVKNYALISELQLDLSRGLTIVTGETGAGKSILLGALSLVLGNRADTSVLRDKEGKCVIEALFDVERYHLNHFFAHHDIDYFPETLIRREINKGGKSRAFINDTPFPLHVIKELGQQLIDVHSQHQNLLLHNESFQLGLLDAFCDEMPAFLPGYKNDLNAYRKVQKELSQMQTNYDRLQEEQSFVQFQYDELEKAALQPGEKAELEETLRKMDHVEEIQSALVHACQSLDLQEIQPIVPSLKDITEHLKRIQSFFSPVEEYASRLESIYVELKDISRELELLQSDLDFDPLKSEAFRERLDLIYQLEKKHQVDSVEALLSVQENFKDQLDALANRDVSVASLKEKEQHLYGLLRSKTATINRWRHSHVPQIKESLLRILAELGMPNARIDIQIQELEDFTSSGKDRVIILFSANKNEALNPIHKVASGGEISRFMLAVKHLLSVKRQLPTIIFDEIDTGVSGEIADKMGNIFKEMSGHMQVINITHLPQVAAKADTHILVYKEEGAELVQTRVVPLSKEQRTKEIAKMLSGSQITPEALNNAKVLLDL